MELPFHQRDVIEIEDSSEEERGRALDDFLAIGNVEDFLPDQNDQFLDFERRWSGDTSASSASSIIPSTVPQTFESCLTEVLEILPDVSHIHVQELYNARESDGQATPNVSASQELVMQILDAGKYPKEKDRLNELKRKRSIAMSSDDERAARWKNAERGVGALHYSYEARNLIQEDFPNVPRRFIDAKFKELGHLYATYLALDLAEETYEVSSPRPYQRLKKSRRPRAGSIALSSNMQVADHGMDETQKELEAARLHTQKLQTERKISKEAAAAVAAEERRLRENRQVMECGCCFDDEVPINKITFCSGDNPHAFCFSCAESNAKTQLGLSRYKLECMHSSGCEAVFSRTERNRFLDSKTIESLERVQQQTELREANLPGLEKCPFCDFAAICVEVEVDREFRCEKPECKRITCRLCKLDTHVPLTCEEYKKENGVSERRIVEEARTAALIRTCPKCKSSVLKDGGCNKVVCPCGGVFCDVCRKDIAKEMYAHFSDGPGITARGVGRGKCPTHDDTYARNEKSVKDAEEAALKKIQEQNPELTEDDLKIKFAESTQTTSRSHFDPMGPNYPFPNAHRIPALYQQALAQQQQQAAHLQPPDHARLRARALDLQNPVNQFHDNPFVAPPLAEQFIAAAAAPNFRYMRAGEAPPLPDYVLPPVPPRAVLAAAEERRLGPHYRQRRHALLLDESEDEEPLVGARGEGDYRNNLRGGHNQQPNPAGENARRTGQNPAANYADNVIAEDRRAQRRRGMLVLNHGDEIRAASAREHQRREVERRLEEAERRQHELIEELQFDNFMAVMNDPNGGRGGFGQR